MPEDLQHALQRGRQVRVDTLVRLRWISVIGQTITILVVHFVLNFRLPLFACLAVIALAAWLNVALRVRFSVTQRLSADRAAWLFAFDIAEIGLLLFLTGGLENPFSFLLLGPVLLSATSLPPRMIVILATFAALATTVLAFYYYPLPWDADEQLLFPAIYVSGTWLATLLSLGFIGIHAWQLTEEARQLSDALAATELVLAREQHLSQLDGIAAAAAHELGTPLATITVVATELERATAKDSPLMEDIVLLREQAQRCRQILGKLTELSTDAEPFDRMQLSALLEDVVAPHRHFGVSINVTLTPREAATEPVGGRNPGILYGLGNLVENAVDFATSAVNIVAEWNGEVVSVTITDDGPGFAAEIMGRIGDPYVTSRRQRRMNVGTEAGGGLGLGFFIAKTLLERSGATLEFANRPTPDHGAVVQVHWGRSDFERPPEFAFD